MTSVERTAYPRFPTLMYARELHVFFTPCADEVVWAREKIDTDDHLMALVLALKCFQKMGRFPGCDEVPGTVIDHVRRCLELGGDARPVYASRRTAESHRVLVRQREGVRYAPGQARKIAEKAITEAAWVKNYPPDLINVALERLVQACLELPAFSTLDEMASRIRGEVNASIFRRIWIRLGPSGRVRLEGLLVVGSDGQSDLNRLKRPAKRASFVRV